MSEKPILFSTPMVQAILDGRKTMTRRVVKSTESWVKEFDLPKPKYQVGNVLWVRETWAPGCMGGYIYKAGHQYAERLQELKQWKPSIHMPKLAARMFLRVTDVRGERVQDITEDDAIAEGVQARNDTACGGTSARIAFAELWDSLNEKRGYGWSNNPWVWVYEFEVLKTR